MTLLEYQPQEQSSKTRSLKWRLLASALCGVLCTIIVLAICFAARKTDTPLLACFACGPALTLLAVAWDRLHLRADQLAIAASFLSSVTVQYALYCFLVLTGFKRKRLALLLVLLFHLACSVYLYALIKRLV